MDINRQVVGSRSYALGIHQVDHDVQTRSIDQIVRPTIRHICTLDVAFVILLICSQIYCYKRCKFNAHLDFYLSRCKCTFSNFWRCNFLANI